MKILLIILLITLILHIYINKIFNKKFIIMLQLRKIVYNKEFDLLIIEPESLMETATVLIIGDLPEELGTTFNVLLQYCIDKISLNELKYFVYINETDSFNIEGIDKNVIVNVISDLNQEEKLKIEDFITDCLVIIN
jgi:hypothetical protein